LGLFLEKYSYVLSFWSIAVRDMLLVAIITWNLIKVMFDKNKQILRDVTRQSEGNVDSHL